MTIVETIHSPRETTILEPWVLEVGMHLIKPWQKIQIWDAVVRNMSKIPWETKLLATRIISYRKIHGQVKAVMIYDALKDQEVWLERKDILYCIKRTF